MYDINLKNVKKGKKFFLIFFIIGILFFLIFGGIYIFNIIKLKNLDSETMSTRVHINSYTNDEGTMMYSPVYYYSVNGIGYSCESSSSSSVNPGTENKKVFYDSNNPSNCMSEFSKSNNNFILLFLFIPIIFIIISIYNFKKISKRIKIINELNQKGKLVKQLPYRLEETGMTVNNHPVMRPVIDYVLPSGVVKLLGDPRHDGKLMDTDGLVDLVIDENNPDNYFIDFEINRLSGNLPGDFYQQGSMVNETISNSQVNMNNSIENQNISNQFYNINNQ